MTVRALSHDSVSRSVGDVWDILVDVRDADGCLVDAAPVVTVTLPDASTATPTVETITTGVYRVTYTVAVSGRYVASAVSAGYGLAYFAAYVSAVTTGTGVPTVAEYKDYVKNDFGSWTDAEIQSTIDVEASAQRAVCRVGAIIAPDLRSAILRRVRVNLSRRTLPVLITVDSDGNNSFIPSRDPEVRRLEGPYRKLVQP